jgi:hypothetical protein
MRESLAGDLLEIGLEIELEIGLEIGLQIVAANRSRISVSSMN